MSDRYEHDTESSLSEADDSSTNHSSSSMDEVREEGLQRTRRKRKGRPKGSKRARIPSDESPDETHEVTEKKQRVLIPVMMLLSMVCCHNLCFGPLDSETTRETFAKEIEETRSRYLSMTRHEQGSFVLSYLQSHSRYDPENGKWEFLYLLGTSSICLNAWLAIYGISMSAFYRFRKRIMDGKSQSLPLSYARLEKLSTKAQVSFSWLQNYAQKFGDKLPDSDKIHLPVCQTKRDVYRMMCTDLEDQQEEPCSESHFYSMWRKHQRHISIPKENRFAKCNKCTIIKTRLMETVDKGEREALKQRREHHLRKQNQERRKYYKHCEKARANPHKYTSIIIDGMDQGKTYLPHFALLAKSTSNMWKLRTHVTGAMLHGLGAHGFFDVGEWQHGSNLTANVLLRTLFLNRENMGSVLYIQLDNCGRENKNIYLFGLCSLLIELKVFRKIKVSFLMVGHTHEDIDQLFSRFSQWLRRHSAITLEKLMQGFENSFTPSPQSIYLDKIVDIKSWISPYLNKLRNHSYPHVFRFKADENGRCKLAYKKWSSDKEWQTCTFGDDSGGPYLLSSLPEDYPHLSVPNYSDMDLDRLAADIRDAKRFMSNVRDKKWWDDWIKEAREIENSVDQFDSDDESGWLLPHLIKAAKERDKSSNDLIHSDQQTSLLKDLSDDDAPLKRPVIIGNTSRKINHPSTEEASTSSKLRPGSMCLLNVEDDLWPQVAQIESLTEDGNKVNIIWFVGSLSGKFVLLKKRQGKLRVPWTDSVDINDIWYSGFQLTEKQNLPGYIKLKIKDFNRDI